MLPFYSCLSEITNINSLVYIFPPLLTLIKTYTNIYSHVEKVIEVFEFQK